LVQLPIATQVTRTCSGVPGKQTKGEEQCDCAGAKFWSAFDVYVTYRRGLGGFGDGWMPAFNVSQLAWLGGAGAGSNARGQASFRVGDHLRNEIRVMMKLDLTFSQYPH
jgi:hypothetical protein